MQEVKKKTFRERIQEAKEWGYLHGLNGLKLPVPMPKEVDSFMYWEWDERPASNLFLYATMENAYWKGKNDREDVVSISPKDRPGFDMRILQKAFDIGREWRRKSTTLAWFNDEQLSEYMQEVAEKPRDNWLWVENRNMAVFDCWVAGFHYEGEENYGDEYIPRNRFIIACDRMRKMQAMYDQGDDPGDEDEHQKVFAYFLRAAEKLEKIGRKDLIECLACPEPYNDLGKYSDEKSFKYGCKKDCRESCRLIDGMCEKERKALKDYYIVPDDDYWPLEEEKYPDWP